MFYNNKDRIWNTENNETARLINPAKNEIERINNVILAHISKNLRHKLQL